MLATQVDPRFGPLAGLAPGRGLVAVTPSDTVDLTDNAGEAMLAPFLLCTADGDVAVVFSDGSTHTFEDVTAGGWVPGDGKPIFIKRVMATGTTGTWKAMT